MTNQCTRRTALLLVGPPTLVPALIATIAPPAARWSPSLVRRWVYRLDHDGSRRTAVDKALDRCVGAVRRGFNLIGERGGIGGWVGVASSCPAGVPA